MVTPRSHHGFRIQPPTLAHFATGLMEEIGNASAANQKPNHRWRLKKRKQRNLGNAHELPPMFKV
jgi:hypothetical protein